MESTYDFTIVYPGGRSNERISCDRHVRSQTGGIDIPALSQWIYEYTGGYLYMVSRIWKILHERIAKTADFPEKKMLGQGKCDRGSPVI